MFILICVRAAETGLLIRRKSRHIERLCVRDERERRHLTAMRDLVFFLFSFSVTFYSRDREGVTVPSVLRGSSVAAVFHTLSHSPLQIQVMQPRSHTISGLF